MAPEDEMKTSEQIERAIRAAAIPVSEARNADVILYSGGVYPEYERELLVKILENKIHPNVILFLTTTGGSPDAAYKIVRCLQENYRGGTVTVFVTSICKSAGTLITLGADELVMADGAELGPLDVQVWSKEEVGEYSSGLTPAQALTTLRFEACRFFEETFKRLRRFPLRFPTKMAAQIATRMSIGVFKPIYEQIDPMRLGEIQRAMLIGGEYGQRVATTNVKEGTVAKLIGSYPSHGFVIDALEAKELFERVREPTAIEYALYFELIPWISEGQKLDRRDGSTKIEFISQSRSAPKADQSKAANGEKDVKDDGTNRTGTPSGRSASNEVAGMPGSGTIGKPSNDSDSTANGESQDGDAAKKNKKKVAP